MTFQNAAELVEALKDRAAQKNVGPNELAEQTGLHKGRMDLLHSGGWEALTVREIASIIEALEIDLKTL
ncbi:helix-turn-helix domain-containing protein [Shinella sp. M31]|uniref:helix-turn-helix domain-containing protein n=1 Tax=Shinella sp. M31 TaxID=3368615 RepID=UPI003BA3574C